MDWLLIGLAADFSWFSPSSWWAIAQVVIGLGFVIFVHELGHFLVAKACGVKCEKFYVGFDAFDIKIGDRVLIPRSLVKWKWGETLYGVGIVPLGGYVKMLGQDDNPGNIEREAQRSQSANDQISDPDLGPIDRSKLDPRSYLAKSVPQRMAIISAGVIFNLIFGVVFAALAFRSGVMYAPAVVGEPIPGSPAWVAGIGDCQITRVGDKPLDEGYVTFIDMVQEVALQASDGPMEIEFQPLGATERKRATVVAEKGLVRGLDVALVGLNQPPATTKLTSDRVAIPGQAAADAVPPFQPRDEIIGLVVDGKNRPVTSISEFKRELIPQFDKPIKVRVVRHENSEPVEIEVPTNRARTLGFCFAWRPIAAVQIGSPAEAAGLKIGDQIISVNGFAVGNLYSFDQRMIALLREKATSVELEIERTSEPTAPPTIEKKTVELRMPQRISEAMYGPTALESIGVAISAEPIVSHVVAGSQAEQAGIRPGDRLLRWAFELPEGYPADDVFGSVREFEMGEGRREQRIGEFYQALQIFPRETQCKLTLKSSTGVTNQVTLPVREANDHFRVTRGVVPTQLELEYQSTAWSEAFALGVNQTWRDATRVWRFLQKLITGEIAVTNLGGPGMIAAAATSEATEGTSRLLLFLTMLSANLAIVNFLPIPVLDGGHMVFLAYEGIFRRPVTERVQVILSYAGLIFILGLMLFVILLDIGRFSSWF